MEPFEQLRQQSERLRELFEALASMAHEDASQIDFGMGFPKESNQTMAVLAAQFQAAMQPVEALREAVETALDAALTHNELREDATYQSVGRGAADRVFTESQC